MFSVGREAELSGVRPAPGRGRADRCGVGVGLADSFGLPDGDGVLESFGEGEGASESVRSALFAGVVGTGVDGAT